MYGHLIAGDPADVDCGDRHNLRPDRLPAGSGGVYSLFGSVTSAGLSQRSVVRAIGTMTNAEAARHLGLPVRSRLLGIERMRMADDEPLALDSVWLPATLGAPLLRADLAATSLYAGTPPSAACTSSRAASRSAPRCRRASNARTWTSAPMSPSS